MIDTLVLLDKAAREHALESQAPQPPPLARNRPIKISFVVDRLASQRGVPIQSQSSRGSLVLFPFCIARNF
jgi:hypothetical protein